MKLRTMLWMGCLSAAMTVSAFPAAAAMKTGCAVGCSCTPAEPTAASNTWNFKGEANNLFKDVQADAQNALYHADKLLSFTDSRQLSWISHAGQLNPLKQDINDMGTKLCRLETIRRVTAPWQQREIDRLAKEERLMVYHTQQAIRFGDAHTRTLWLPTYQTDVTNLFNEAQALNRSVNHAVEYASVSKEYRGLAHDMGARTGL